jgi:uncharacterized protein (TIGR00255 family)
MGGITSTLILMESMTGHGRGSDETEGWRFTVECGSVNRKGIEIAIALPKPLASLEPKVRELIQQSVRRGRITVTLTLESASVNGADQGVIDKKAALKALHELRALQKELSIPGEVSLELLLRSPGVLKNPGEDLPQPEELWQALRNALSQALERMTAMRKKEGAYLVTDVLKRVKLLETAAKAIRARVPTVLRQRRDHLKSRLEELGLPLTANDPALARELAFMAERSDITEELTRLESHFAQCREALGGTAPAGRTLDYLAQEMFREFNTLGNKAGDAAVSQRVVQSKAELDRIREQVANLE